jgi:hypothetical protein
VNREFGDPKDGVVDLAHEIDYVVFVIYDLLECTLEEKPG